MGKEAKIGIAILASLLLTFGGVLAYRLTQASKDGSDPKLSEALGGALKADKKSPEKATTSKVAAKGNVKTKTAGKAPAKTTVALKTPAVTKPKSTARYLPKGSTTGHKPHQHPPTPPHWKQMQQQSQHAQQAAPKSSPFSQGQASQHRQSCQHHQIAVLPAPPTSRNAAQPTTAQRTGYARTPGYAAPKSAGRYPAYPPTTKYATPASTYPARPTTAAGYGTTSPQYASGTSRGVSLPSTAAKDGIYKVHPNDNYCKISQKFYGTESYFKALAEHNRDQVPQENELAVGQEISVPEIAELEEDFPDLCPKANHRDIVKAREANAGRLRNVSYNGGRTYTVQEGDTLFDIARYELGKASRWIEIHQLNRELLGDDYDYLSPGLELVLPSNQKQPERVTDRPRHDVAGRPIAPPARTGGYYPR